MFHTYVTASSGRQIDFDRARYLMDDALLAEAEKARIKWVCPAGFNPFDIAAAERMGYTKEQGAQAIWQHYCRLHEARYGQSFVPDVCATWDT